MVGRIDWDVFVDGQDWKLSDLKITPVSQTATQADIRATFTNFGDPRDILISLVLEDGHWRIDEVQETLMRPTPSPTRRLTKRPTGTSQMTRRVQCRGRQNGRRARPSAFPARSR